MKKFILILIVIISFGFKVDKSISGIVTDNNDQPIAFAFVYEKNTTNTTYSDDNGNFILPIKKSNTINIIISHKSFGIIDTTIINNKQSIKIKYPRVDLNHRPSSYQDDILTN